MSKVGKKPILIPEGVIVEIKPGQVNVSGPKGNLSQEIRSEIKVEKKDNQILVQAKSSSRLARALHGLLRSLIANMIEGVTKGFEKTLELQGVGYRVSLEGETTSPLPIQKDFLNSFGTSQICCGELHFRIFSSFPPKISKC